MQLRPDVLEGHLKQATTKGLTLLYIVHGGEHLLTLEAIDALRQAVCAQGLTEREAMGVERGFSWSRVTEARQSMPLFGDCKTIELHIPPDRPGKDGGEAPRALATDTLSGPATDTAMLIILSCLDLATVKSAWFAVLEDAGASIRADSMDHIKLPGWIGERLARQRQRVEPDKPGRRALQSIADHVEGNLLVAYQKIQELGLLRPPGVLMFDGVYGVALSVAWYGVFRLSEAILAGDVPRLVRMLEGLRGKGEATVLVLWTLTEEIRVLSETASGAAQDKLVASMLRELRVWDPRERLAPQAAQRLSQCELEEALSMVAKLDRQVKGLYELSLPAGPWDGLL